MGKEVYVLALVFLLVFVAASHYPDPPTDAPGVSGSQDGTIDETADSQDSPDTQAGTGESQQSAEAGEDGPARAEDTQSAQSDGLLGTLLLWGGAALLLAGLGAGAYVLYKKKKNDLPKPKPPKHPEKKRAASQQRTKPPSATPHPQLDRNKLALARQYARNLKAKGVSEDRIRSQLEKGGWPDAYVEAALRP